MPVRYELDGHVATITIDHPAALNAIDLETWQGFAEATQRLEGDEQAWVGIITGAGEKAFCAGADIVETIPRLMRGPAEDDPPAMIMNGQQLSKPVIAAVNGVALGGGLEIVLACDLRVSAENARFAAPEVGLGLIPGWGATQRLPRELPWALAARLILSGDLIDATEALRIGLVNEIVPAAMLMSRVGEIAEGLSRRGPLALRAAKQAMLAAYELPLREGLKVEQRAFLSLAGTEDLREGLAAFAEKRAPKFRAL